MNPDLIDEPEEYWDDPKHEIKSTKCRCTPDKKAKSRALLDSEQKRATPVYDLGVKVGGASLEKRASSGEGASRLKWTSLKRWVSLGKKVLSEKRASLDKGAPLERRNVLDESDLPNGSQQNSSTRLDVLPPEILHPILDMVYADESRSRDLCRCSRPKTGYWKVREVSLDHHVVNTAPLRRVCRAFHGWALESVFKGGKNIEVDLSDLKGLEEKRGRTGIGIMTRLIEDFPRLKNGVVIYLGNPGYISNVKAVVEVMNGGQASVFSGVTLWDLNYYHREQVPGVATLAFSKVTYVETLNTPEMSHAQAVMANIARKIYHEDRLLFTELLISLVSNSLALSTMHVPVASILDDILSTISNEEYRSLTALTRGCRSVVFREFFGYNDTHVEEIREHFAAMKHQVTESNLDSLEGEARLRMLTEKVRTWGDHITEPLDARHIEIRRVGGSPPPWMIGYMPLEYNMHQTVRMFKDLKTLVIEGVDYEGLKSGTLLHTLVPLRQTLSTLIYKTEHRTVWDNPHTVHHFSGQQPSMDPHHACALLRQFPKLKTLDLPSRFCYQLFEDYDDDACSEQALERDWNLRLPPGWCLCSYDERAIASLPTASLWSKELMESFLQSSRVWRDRFEDYTNCKTNWNLKIHADAWDDWPALGGHAHQIVFMPLASPPCALLQDCDEGWHREGLYEEKEGWIITSTCF